MTEKKVKATDIMPKTFSCTIQSLLNVHHSRLFRMLFCFGLILHLSTILLRIMSLYISISPNFLSMLDHFHQTYWSTSAFKEPGLMNHITSTIFEIISSLVLVYGYFTYLLYIVDLVLKLSWRSSAWMKAFNVVAVATIQASMMILNSMKVSMSPDILKPSIQGAGVLLLLLLELLSFRTDEALNNEKSKKVYQKKVSQPIQNGDKRKLYTWAEIIKHDKREDCWISIHGKVYDVTHFVKNHPGGYMIYDGAGGDCTAMWESYHPLHLVKKGPFEQYCIGEVRNYRPYYTWTSDFYYKLKERVEAKIPLSKRRNDPVLFIQSTVILTLWALAWYNWMKKYDFWSTIFFGFLSGQIGVNVMHDANHAAWSSNKFVSFIVGYTLDLIGSSSVVFRRSHNFGHHDATNHFELDRGFNTTYPFFRLHKFQSKLPMHAYQHIYVWIIYGLVNFGDIGGTFDELSWMSNYPQRKGNTNIPSVIMQVFIKIWCFSGTLFIPSYFHGWYYAFPYWMLYWIVFGYSYALFFAVNHWTEEAYQIDYTVKKNTDWAALQVENSSNFSMDSPFWTQLSGGLNYQIEHHLFPSMPHTRLELVRPILLELCKEYKIRYFAFNSFWSALKAHYDFLKKMGNSNE